MATDKLGNLIRGNKGQRILLKLGIKELAQILGRSTSTVRRLIREGKIVITGQAAVDLLTLARFCLERGLLDE